MPVGCTRKERAYERESNTRLTQMLRRVERRSLLKGSSDQRVDESREMTDWWTESERGTTEGEEPTNETVNRERIEPIQGPRGKRES